MKIVVIGAVAGGTSAAAKARRNDEFAEIVIFEKEKFISYSGCGMPYFLGGMVEEYQDLVPRNEGFFAKKYNIQVKTGFEVLSIDGVAKTVSVKNLETDELFIEKYDKLILATGASAKRPDVEGIWSDHVFTLRNIDDILKIDSYLKEKMPKYIAIIGSGMIGLELAENLSKRGFLLHILEAKEEICPGLDGDMSQYLEAMVERDGLSFVKNVRIEKVNPAEILLKSGEKIPADCVLVATGVAPNTGLAESAGVKLGVSGAVAVDDKMATNVPDIYACGDCIETFSAINQIPVYRPLGSTANKTGRIAGDVASGGDLAYRGNLGTGIVKFFDFTVAFTGFTQKEAEKLGYDVQICHNIKPDRPEYLGGSEMLIKGVADRKSGRLLGVQILGKQGVDKRIDVFATLITYSASVDDLFHLDLAYAPPFSTTKDPVHYTGMILDNAISGKCAMISIEEMERLESPVQIVDARSPEDFSKKGTVSGAVNLPQAILRGDQLPLDPQRNTVTFCNKGVTGNAAQNILKNRGFSRVYNLSGGHKFYSVIKRNKGQS